MNTSPFAELAHLDRTVHEPTRLAILTALAACTAVDFLFLQGLTGLTKGNLSSHLAKLEAAGLVEIEKDIVDKRTHTLVRLSLAGRGKVEEHWKDLEALRHRAASWRLDAPVPEPAGG